MKKLTPLMIIHLVLMALVALFGIVAAVALFRGPAFINGQTGVETVVMIYGAVNIVNTLALCCGIVYLLNSYGKAAAGYYKGFLMLIVVASVLNMIDLVLIDKIVTTPTQSGTIPLILMIIKTLVLLVLVFWKDLGKRNTWIAFGVLLCADLLFGLIYQSDSTVASYRIVSVLARLAADGTIGLAIRGKYADKERRGTV